MAFLRPLVALCAVLVLLVVAPSAPAIVDGEFDGTDHSYVAFVIEDLTPDQLPQSCSGVLVAPQIVVTAAHCARADEMRMAVTFAPNRRALGPPWVAPQNWLHGTLYYHPDFTPGGNGLPDFTDLAVIVLDAPVAIQPARLPTLGLADTLDNKTWLLAVGYGVQEFGRAREPLPPNGNRMRAPTRLVPGGGALGDDYLKIKGAVCLGDSGGPTLLGDVALAIVAFMPSPCDSVAYATRLDTRAARDFLAAFGVSLP